MRWDPDFCVDPASDPDPEDPGRWIAEGQYEGFNAPFSVWADDDRLLAIELRTVDLATDRGISLASTETDLLAAYPDVTNYESTPIASVYHAQGPGQILVFEVARDTGTGYWDAADVGRVIAIVATLDDGEDSFLGSRAASDYVIGGCL